MTEIMNEGDDAEFETHLGTDDKLGVHLLYKSSKATSTDDDSSAPSHEKSILKTIPVGTTQRGQHGVWEYHVQYGWRPQIEKRGTDWNAVAETLQKAPWLKIDKPPGVDETKKDFHNRLREARAIEEQQWKERWNMCSHDKELHAGTYVEQIKHQSTKTAGEHVSNIAAEFFTREDANAELQRTQPEWYGPYLKEGECYEMPRTPENLAQALQDMKIDEIPLAYAGHRQTLEKLVYHYWVLFDGKMRSVHGVELDMNLSHLKPIRKQPYKWSPQKMEAGKALIEEFEMLNLVCQVASEWGAPALIVPKPHANPNASFVDRFRLVIDYRELNKYIAHDTYEPPSCELCIGWLAGKPVRSVADMRWGFHQVKVSDRMRKYFTFVTPFGTWSYNRLVMGFINATAEFQRCMNHTLGNCLYRNCVAMVDDLIVASETMEQHVDDLWEVFAKLAARGHSIKPKKLRFIPEEVEYHTNLTLSTGKASTWKSQIACLAIHST